MFVNEMPVRLGFGTAALMGRIGERESTALLECAYESGIRYFDTAPSYGYGQAEALLGKFAATKPDVIVATKFGLSYAGRSSRALHFAARVARPILNAAPGLRARVGGAARSSTPATSNFSAAFARVSLQRSLQHLRRDAVDVFLLHECRAADLGNGELLAELYDAVRRGDIREFGIGTDPLTVAFAMTQAPGFTRVLQFENNTRNPNIEKYHITATDRTIVTHTPFGGVGQPLDGSPAEELRFALSANKGGVVLFSSTNKDRIRANARVAESVAVP